MGLRGIDYPISVAITETDLFKLKKRLKKVESQIEAIGVVSPLTHGWQTAKYANTSKVRDYLGAEKTALRIEIDEIENKSFSTKDPLTGI